VEALEYTLGHVASILCNIVSSSSCLAKDPYVLAQLRNVSLSFPDKKIFEDVSLTVYPGDRISLVGENGAGKTSVFRMLKGRLAPDSGEVSLSRGVRIGYLEQDFAGMEEDPKRTCMEVALEPFGSLIELEKRIERLAFELGEAGESESTSELLADLGEAQQRLEVSGGYEFRSRTQSTLMGLGLFEAFWNRRVSELSAGQRVRLALARLLLEDHELILFDEPTNHLDVPAREWLEGHLAGMDTAYVVASHDRRFLNTVSRKVAHLDRGKLTLYSGDYTAFRRQQKQAEEEGWRRYEKSRKLAKKLQRQAQDYQRWSESGEKKKRGAADKGFVSHKAAKVMKRSLVARRRMEEAIENARTEKPFEKDAVKIEFGSSKGRSLLRAEEVVVGYSKERPLTRELSFDLWSGDRLAILGPNGCGKTALLRTVLGEILPLRGDVRLAPSSNVGYFDQDNCLVPLDVTALGAVLGTGRGETLVRTVMGRMGVRRETVNKKVAKLSSGERAKVLLATLILGDNNLLVLDEPTNYLDIETQDVLLEALVDFPGGILFVSHDRYFVEELATDIVTLGLT
jgi:ATP-binding cassette, subfamily F, member 3